ncbi:winged helix-turn-helix domain-containing tetratricopeptide repeat protein [Limimaricola soesokkakensis]|uniref:winged helix-turn-helix domain-containing tetratricopeptide repeat protein n=1 Tax=Limimaricola soesokkakensis TaxID=1343159 RepID=UPI003518FF7B
MARIVRIEIAERRVLVDGVPTRLRPKSFDLLALLASRPGHLFSAEILLERVWAGRCVSPGVLPGCIREIRRALHDSALAPTWIQTVTGTGYRLLKVPKISAKGGPPARARGLADAPVAECRPGEVSVGVLPFDIHFSGKAAVANALSRDIAVGLARTRWLTVAASASAEALSRDTARKTAAQVLGVDYLVEGDLREADDALALQVALIDARTERILWADRMPRRDGDVAALMEDVCNVIVAAVEREIESHEQKRAMVAPVRGVEPWISLHRAMGLLQRHNREALPSIDTTLRAAARSDPTCSRIAAARSWQAWQESFFGLTQDREDGLRRARDLALESISLDVLDPLGHWSLGRARWLSGELEAAAENLQHAVTLNPSFAIGHYSLGYTLYLTGREADAMRCCDLAIRLSPLDPMAFAFHCIKAHLSCFDGKRDEALHHARRIADHPNVHAFALAVAAWVNEICGNRRSALECLTRIRHISPTYSRHEYMAALFHQSPWYPAERRRAIERAFDRLGF